MEKQTSRAIEIMCSILGALTILLISKDGFFTASALPFLVMFIIYIVISAVLGFLYFIIIGAFSYQLSFTNRTAFNLIRLFIIIIIAIACLYNGYVS